MGNHGAAGNQHAKESTTTSHSSSPRVPTLRNWPVSWRLIAVIVMALVMGLVFGGLRVSAAADNADEFNRVAALADLGQQVTGLIQALQNERDETAGLLPVSNPSELRTEYSATNAAAAKVQALAAGINGSFPANIQSKVSTVLSEITHLQRLRNTALISQSVQSVLADYGTPIGDMISLNDQIAQGTSDAGLVSDVESLNSLALAKDQAGQQRALLFNALNQQIFADGVQQALITAQSEQLNDQTAFSTTATAQEQATFNSTVTGPQVNRAQNIETYILSVGSLDIDQGSLNISPTAAPGVWYSAMSGTVDTMQQVELGIARSIVSRAQVLKRGAEQSALFTAILTVVILLLVLIATLAVARSLVLPLRRLREGALNIATVELPERVRLLNEAPDTPMSVGVEPIDVLSADEIGQVARAFDQVHSEAVRLASNEAMLRNNFNAMFVNLSRRSQSLIERLVRMIDALEQNEGDPERLSNLFAMDHLVTRMRRNSENLLLLAGHEGARKWSEPVLLADVARAAVSEIEQYSRVTLKIQPGIAVSGQAVSDVVHLLAEIIENATIFSARDTPVQISAQELTSGGVLIEVSDSGVGIPDTRLAELNWRLDNPPVIDVSLSRHMGLFAVARLAERHGVRIRLGTRSPHGLTALVWLPDNVIEQPARPYGARSRLLSTSTQASFPMGVMPGGHAAMRPATDGQFAGDRREAMPEQHGTGPREAIVTVGAGGSEWFRGRRGPAPASTGNGGSLVTVPQAGGGKQVDTDGWALGKHAAQIVADPVRGDNTAAGLPMRVPQANLIPGSVGGERRAGDTASHQAHALGAPTATAPRAPRSADAARSRLSGFQRGVRRAKGQTPRAGEGADR
ncbi:MAG: sensor histidine kinase [Streptosporangiaceae bacterium]